MKRVYKFSERMVPMQCKLALKLASLLAVAGLSIAVLQSGVLAPRQPEPTAGKQVNTEANTKPNSRHNTDDAKSIRFPMSSFGTRAQTLEEALPQIAIKPKLPDPVITGNPKEIYVLGAMTPEEKGIGIVFEDGSNITIYPKAQAPNYDLDVKRYPNDFTLVDINGNKGMAAEPKKKILQSHGEVQEPGCVTWHKNGIEYAVYGNNEGSIPLEQLLTIAKSMR